MPVSPNLQFLADLRSEIKLHKLGAPLIYIDRQKDGRYSVKLAAALAKDKAEAVCQRFIDHMKAKGVVGEMKLVPMLNSVWDNPGRPKGKRRQYFSARVVVIPTNWTPTPKPEPVKAKAIDPDQIVWLVFADTHDFDAMSQWPVGVYTSERRAKSAAKRAKGKGINIEITKLVLNVDEEPGV